jgi:general secretion pathway protein G
MKKGFTLIEILVVITIIGTLLGIASVSYLKSLRSARDTRRKTDLEQIRQALETYRSELGIYPLATSTFTPSYITTLPKDPPGNTADYPYTRNTTITYSLCATIENPPSTYCVTQP